MDAYVAKPVRTCDLLTAICTVARRVPVAVE